MWRILRRRGNDRPPYDAGQNLREGVNIMSTATMSEFRIDPVSGLKVNRTANTLVKWNAFAAVVFLLVGGLFGLGVALTRMPSVQLLPPELFYMALTAHGLVNLAVWIIFFEMALLYFCGAHLLNNRIATPGWAWTQFLSMVVGAAMVAVAVLEGQSSGM